MRFLQHTFESKFFLVRLGWSFVIFLPYPIVWWRQISMFPSTYNFPFLPAFWFFIICQLSSLICFFFTFHYEHCWFFYAKFHSYILAVYSLCLYQTSNFFSFLANSFISSMSKSPHPWRFFPGFLPLQKFFLPFWSLNFLWFPWWTLWLWRIFCAFSDIPLFKFVKRYHRSFRNRSLLWLYFSAWLFSPCSCWSVESFLFSQKTVRGIQASYYPP